MYRTTTNSLTLYGRDGRRKYLTPAERGRFIAAAKVCSDPKASTFCLILAYSGCRISEALSLTTGAVHVEERSVTIRTLKRRDKLVVREIPLPEHLVALLQNVHGLPTGDGAERLWNISRTAAWLLVKRVMLEAAIPAGVHASPKGLRHGFAIHALRTNVPLSLVQRWLGHASIATTAIYLQVMGAEEREIAERMWK